MRPRCGAASQARDASSLMDLYAEDATVERVDAQNPPSSPARIAGRDAIRAALEDVYARDMTHRSRASRSVRDAVGYTVRCSYPDGTRVLCAAVAELRDGRIVREVGVQAWDG